jgi:hypothetical protein
MVENDSKIVPISSKIYYCECCIYSTSRKSQYTRHLVTAKHIKRVNDSEMVVKKFQKVPEQKGFACDCGKVYKYDSGFYRHKKKCNFQAKVEANSEPIVEFLLKENHEMKKENLEMKKDNLEMKKMMIDLCKKIEPVSNNTNINSHNKIFNINLFLNEDCKDAMNMTEFIESIQLSIEDVEKIGMEGQTQALSNILSSKLNEMDIFKRPVHCSDAKKEIIYVKDEDKWEQEEKGKPKLKKALDKIAKESLCKVPEMTSDADNYVKTISEILKDPREDKKILSAVSKVLLVN